MTPRKLLQSLAAMTMLVGVGLGGVTAIPAGASTQDGTTAAISDDSPSAQITRLYEAFFLRTPPEADRVFWVNDLNSGNRTLEEIAEFFASGQEFDDTYGELSNQEFVEQVYLNVQGRPGEADGVAFWTGELDSEARTRGGVMVGFSNGEEFREVLLERFDDSAIFRLYCAYFLRAPDAGGRAFWKGEFANGESIAAIADRFAQVPEFEAAFGADTTDAQFVDKVYLNVLDRARVDADGTFWLDQLTSAAFTRGRVMIGFSEAPEYAARFTSDPPTACPTSGGVTVDPPVATDDTATTGTGVDVIIDVLSNDTGDDAAITQLNDPVSGSVVDNGDGTVTYTPATGFDGDDTFTYVVGNAGGTDTGTVTVTVAAGAPTANADSVADANYNPENVNSGSAVTTDLTELLSNDTLNGNVITAAGTTAEGDDLLTDQNGKVAISGDGLSITYTAPGDFRGTDTFTYTLGTDPSSTATVTLDVRPRETAEVNCGVFLTPPTVEDLAADPVIDGVDAFTFFLRSGGCFQVYEFDMPDLDGSLSLVYSDVSISIEGGAPIDVTADVVQPTEIIATMPIDPLDFATGEEVTLTATATLSDDTGVLMTNVGMVGVWEVAPSGVWIGQSGTDGTITFVVDPFAGRS